VQRQFYGVVLCAFCQEFLLKAAGMQCEDCRFTCHKKCYDKVVTKCVSKTNAETVSVLLFLPSGKFAVMPELLMICLFCRMTTTIKSIIASHIDSNLLLLSRPVGAVTVDRLFHLQGRRLAGVQVRASNSANSARHSENYADHKLSFIRMWSLLPRRLCASRTRLLRNVYGNGTPAYRRYPIHQQVSLCPAEATSCPSAAAAAWSTRSFRSTTTAAAIPSFTFKAAAYADFDRWCEQNAD
jgi:hypothetical protein